MARVDTAQAALNSRLAATNGRTVSYVRGATTLSITAWVGRTVFASNLEGGARIEFGERDYLITAAALTLGEPAIGDRITETINGTATVFEVCTPTTGDPAYRYSDQTRTLWRIHCVKVVL